MSAQLLSSQSKLLVKCLVACIVATAGNSVTAEKGPDRDFAVLLYAAAVRYAKTDRINVDFGSELMKRAEFFQPHFPLGPVPANILDLLKAEFPEESDAATVKFIFNLFQRIKTFGREHAAGYIKDKKTVRSGTYNDTEYLKDKLWKKIVIKQFDTNALKNVRIIIILTLHLISLILIHFRSLRICKSLLKRILKRPKMRLKQRKWLKRPRAFLPLMH